MVVPCLPSWTVGTPKTGLGLNLCASTAKWTEINNKWQARVNSPKQALFCLLCSDWSNSLIGAKGVLARKAGLRNEPQRLFPVNTDLPQSRGGRPGGRGESHSVFDL